MIVNGQIVGSTGRTSGGSTTTATIPASKQVHVFINVYEPTQGQNPIPGFGIYHTGIEFSGVEYCYAGAPEGMAVSDTLSGVGSQTPKTTPPGTGWKYKETIDLGPVKHSSSELMSILDEFKKAWPAKSYHLIHNNCNSFSKAFVTRLGLKFPSWINRAANWAKPFSFNGQAQPAVVEAPKSVFQTSKGYSLSTGAAVDSKAAAKAAKKDSKKAEAQAPQRKNPWSDPNFMPSAKKDPISAPRSLAAASS
jgi:hypothetical protein